MGYLHAKSDLQFMHEFADAVIQLLKIEDQAAHSVKSRGLAPRDPTGFQHLVQAEAGKTEDYGRVRARVARGVPRAKRIADGLGLLTVFESHPMPAVPGPVITVALFDAILHDPTYSGVPKQSIIDVLNQTLGACQERVSVGLRHLINPIYWVKEMLVFIIRIPFMIVEASGFDVSKVEDHFLGKAFKLLEIIVLIAVLVRLGLTKEELHQAVITFLSGLGGGG